MIEEKTTSYCKCNLCLEQKPMNIVFTLLIDQTLPAALVEGCEPGGEIHICPDCLHNLCDALPRGEVSIRVSEEMPRIIYVKHNFQRCVKVTMGNMAGKYKNDETIIKPGIEVDAIKNIYYSNDNDDKDRLIKRIDDYLGEVTFDTLFDEHCSKIRSFIKEFWQENKESKDEE